MSGNVRNTSYIDAVLFIGTDNNYFRFFEIKDLTSANYFMRCEADKKNLYSINDIVQNTLRRIDDHLYLDGVDKSLHAVYR